jgi:hypothetical protein
MRRSSGLRTTALIAFCAVELVSLATIIAAAATAPLVPDDADQDPVDGPDHSRHPRPLATPHRLAQ